jgi:hypothetical protein
MITLGRMLFRSRGGAGSEEYLKDRNSMSRVVVIAARRV